MSGLIYVLLCSGLLPLVQMRYMSADNQNGGYVTLNKAPDTYPVGYNLKMKRYLGPADKHMFQKKHKENGKSSTKKANDQFIVNHLSTELPKQQIKNNTGHKLDPRNSKVSRGTKATNTSPQNSQSNLENRREPYLSKVSSFDNKGLLQVNVHKTQIAADPLKVRLNNNRQLSMQRREEAKYKRVPTSVLLDKTMQSGTNFKERNTKIMTRVLDDMTNKIADARPKPSEYKKRDTENASDAPILNNISDKKRKYIGKDFRKQNPTRAARIGNREEEFENNAPYALFYRMAPESLENHEDFYQGKQMANEAENIILTHAPNENIDQKAVKSTTRIDTLKFTNRLKNFANFRSV